MVSRGISLVSRQRYVRLGALGGQSLSRANTIVTALADRWSLLQRDVAEAVARGELPRARLEEIDAISGEISALTDNIYSIEDSQIETWASWARDIDARLRTFEATNSAAIASVRRIRSIKVALGFGVAGVIAGAVGYTVWRNRKGSRA